MPLDIQSIIKIIRMFHDKEQLTLSMSHEQIVNHSIYKQAVLEVLDTLKGIENGNIDIKELLRK